MAQNIISTVKHIISNAIERYYLFEQRLESRASTPEGKEWVRYGSRITLIFLTIIFAIGFLDLVFMPWFVGHNDIVRMPNVAGMSYNQAARILEDNGFSVKVASEYYNNAIPSGHIVNQMPLPTSLVKKSRTVYVTLSRGKQLLEVPNLVGLTVRDARIALIRLGLSLNNAAYQFNDHIPVNIIFSQSLTAKQKVGFGARVDVSVSLGPEVVYVIVPDVEGKSLDEARRILGAAGFTVGEVTDGEVNDTFMPGTVIKQIPPPMDSVKTGTPINLTVTK